MQTNRRQYNRIASDLPVEIAVDSQIKIQGRLKDLSARSAFVTMKSSVYMQINDLLNFTIKCGPEAEGESKNASVSGEARISRIAAGEGIIIYFTKLAEGADKRLNALVG